MAARSVPAMNLILIPGFWLDASSWDSVAPALRAAGHDVRALTLPGLESADADRSEITLRDHIDAVVAEIDASDGPVVLVGHSGGGSIAHGATDARPDRVARVIYVDSFPPSPGGVINDELPSEHGEVPLPDWAAFEGELADFTEQQLDEFRARAIPEPEHVAADPIELHDERRFQVPVTLIATTMLEADYRNFLQPEHPWRPMLDDLARIESVSFIDLPTSHWPQFTRPDDLAAAILKALETA